MVTTGYDCLTYFIYQQNLNRTAALEEIIPYESDKTVLSPTMCKHQSYDLINQSGVIVGYEVSNSSNVSCPDGYIYHDDRYNSAFIEVSLAMCLQIPMSGAVPIEGS